MRWFETPTFKIVDNRKIGYIVSGILILASLAAITLKGLQYGIDFKGGKEIVVIFEQPVDVTQIRSELTPVLNSVPETKTYGSPREILIRTDSPDDMNTVQSNIETALANMLPDNPFSVEKTDTITPRFAEDLKSGALQAVIYSLIFIFLYILIRFSNWTFSLGAVAALLHDVTITLGVFTILSDFVNFNLQIDQAIIAAFLTIVGYSLNDTVVVFDRIRENSRVHKGMEYFEMVNKSLNDTLSRTVITSLTTLFVVTILFIFGGEVLKGFSFALIIGIILGTYSSLFIASPIVAELKAKQTK